MYIVIKDLKREKIHFASLRNAGRFLSNLDGFAGTRINCYFVQLVCKLLKAQLIAGKLVPEIRFVEGFYQRIKRCGLDSLVTRMPF